MVSTKYMKLSTLDISEADAKQRRRCSVKTVACDALGALKSALVYSVHGDHYGTCFAFSPFAVMAAPAPPKKRPYYA